MASKIACSARFRALFKASNSDGQRLVETHPIAGVGAHPQACSHQYCAVARMTVSHESWPHLADPATSLTMDLMISLRQQHVVSAAMVLIAVMPLRLAARKSGIICRISKPSDYLLVNLINRG